MKIRVLAASLAAAFAIILAAGLMTGSAVVAQQDPIAARKALMKQNNDHARSLVQMIRGQAPFDAAVVDESFRQWADTASKLPGLFPDNSKTGEETRASAKIWENKADFDAHAAAFGKAVADNRDKAKGSLDGLKAALGPVGGACDNCHKDYRLPRR